jgi:hypothetical protein
MALAACGDGQTKPATVTGKVVYKGSGEPATRLARGYVCLLSVADPNNKPTGQIEDDATFFLGAAIDGKNLGGVLPGEYKVRVVPPQTESGRTARGLIEPRYQSFDKSGLLRTIVAGKNEITIEVEKAKK